MSTSAEPAIKSYFFGKGYRDLIAVITESWERNLNSAKNFFSRTKTYGEWWEIVLSFIFWGGAGVSVIVFGTLFFVAVSLLHILFLGLFFLLIYIGFTLVWLLERTYLFFRGFFSVCPHCHEKTVLPEYLCDKCGKIHTRLIPNSYGILFHQCLCGKKLPATFFLNRGQLQARCQACHQLLHREHIESRKIFVPILGGPSAGKTAFMFAVVRQFIEEKAAAMGFETAFVESKTESEYQSIVNQLSQGNVPTKTVASIPKAFNLELKKGGQTKWVLYIYDPAGEAFENTENLTAHLYYEYLSGMIMIVDPFSIPAVRRDYENELSRTSSVNPSQLNLEDALAGVLLTLEESFGLSKTGQIKKPLAVVISKVDAFGLEKLIGEEAVGKAVGNDSNRNQIKSDLIRQQLRNWDEGALIQQIETRFKSVQYFSCSALGRVADSTSNDDFVPHHVFEPMSWIFNSVSSKEFNSMGSKDSNTFKPPLGIVTFFGNFARQYAHYFIGLFLVIIIFYGIFSFTRDNPQQPVSSTQTPSKVAKNVRREQEIAAAEKARVLEPVGDYPETATRRLTDVDIAGKSERELRIMRNEIFARHGYYFGQSDLQTHFEKKSWYKPIARNSAELYDNHFTPIEQDNVKFLQQSEREARLIAEAAAETVRREQEIAADERTRQELLKEETITPIELVRARNQAVIYQENGTFHLGDERIRSWKALHGDCYTATFYVNRTIETLTLKLDIWGSESRSNAIFLNDMEVNILPYQEQRTRKWIKEQVVLHTYGLQQGRDNQLQICSGVTTEGDKDDLQIRKIRLIAE